MRRTIFVMAIFLLVAIPLFSQNFKCKEENADNIKISFEVNDYELVEQKLKKRNFTKISIKNKDINSFTEKNYPDLPSFSKLIIVPDGTKPIVKFSVESKRKYSNMNIIPSQGYTRDSEKEADTEIDLKKYKNYKQPGAVRITETGIMRNYTVARVAINPFRYSSEKEELEVYENIDITINFESTGRKLPKIDKGSKNINMMLKNLAVNSETVDRLETDDPGSYLFVYNGDTVLEVLNYLVEWKRKMGYEVNMLNVWEGSGSAMQVKESIVQAYNSYDNPPEYICLVGDAGASTTQIPTFYESYYFNISGDYPYSLLDGEDNFPDALVSRITFNNNTQLATIISKIRNYEMNVAQDNQWLNNYLLVGDPIDSGISTIHTMKYIRQLIEGLNPNATFDEVYSSPFDLNINESINEGAAAFYYRGFGGTSQWNSNDIDELVNTGKYPFATLLTCFTGEFDGSQTSVIEAFLKSGTPNNPTGGCAVIGASSATHTCFNNLMTGSIANAVHYQEVDNLTVAMNYAKMALYESYPDNPNQYVDQYLMLTNMLGDPGMQLRTGVPETINLEFTETVPIGTSNINVLATNNSGVPLADVWVAIGNEDDETYTSGYTNTDGSLNLGYQVDDQQDLDITATKKNCVPVIAQIEVNDDSVVGFQEVVDLNNFDSGKTADFHVSLINYTNMDYDQIELTLTSDNEYIEITESETVINSLPAGEEAVSSDPFLVGISPECPHDEVIGFELIGSDMNFYFELETSAPILEITSINLDSGNDYFVPGSEETFSVEIQNLGNSDFAASDAVLSSDSPYLEIIDSLSTYPSIPVNEVQEDNSGGFTISLSDDIIPGISLLMTIQLVDANEIQREITFSLNLGEQTAGDPTSDNSYGYFCFEDDDNSYDLSPEFDWIEIDPSNGGEGTVLDLYDVDENGSGDFEVINLPFSFTFYGETYNTLTISSNGYVVLGNYDTVEWMNWPIPSPFMPAPIIAPFWDDLLILNGSVSYLYDAENARFIVEWSNLQNRYDHSTETFQLILYDFSEYPSVTGDNQIKFQYLEVNNNDQGNYGDALVDHGEYATIGIGDHTRQRGIEMTYANEYPETAHEIDDNSAMLIKTISEPQIEPKLLVTNVDVTDLNGNQNNIPDAGERVDLSVSLFNIGENKAENISAELVGIPEYVEVIDSELSFPDIEGQQGAESNDQLTIEISSDCPNLSNLIFDLSLNYSAINDTVSMNLLVFAPDLGLKETIVTDSNDNQLAAGESGNICFEFERESYLPLNSLVIECDTESPYIEISPEEVNLGDIDQDEFEAEFEISIAEEADNGIEYDFEITANFSGTSKTFTYSYLIGEPILIFEENFDEFDYDNWDLNINTEFVDDNLAGGDAPEIHLNSTSSTWAYLKTNSLYASNARKYIVKFKYRNYNGNAQYGLGIDQQPCNLWSDNVEMDEPDSVRIELYPGEIGMGEFNWSVNPNYGQTFAIDDIEIYKVTQNTTTVYGNVSTDNVNADLSEVNIFANSYSSNYMTNPNEEGYFEFVLEPEEYVLSAGLSGYVSDETEIVLNGQDSCEVDFYLEYLTPPENLVSSFDEETDVVALDWEYNEPLQSRKVIKRSREPEFEYFILTIIYNESSTLTVNTTNTHYERTLFTEGNYEFYVQAHYDGGFDSSPSNSIFIEYVGLDDDEEIIENKIGSLYPNPVRLKKDKTNGVNLDLSLADLKSSCKIKVYNIKGELVRALKFSGLDKGRHTVSWDCRNNQGNQVSSGIYFYKIDFGGENLTKKLMIVK